MSQIQKHTFAICAYKDSPYLEKCIKSIKKQTAKSKVILCTSTPSEYISELAKKYDIPVYIRKGASDIKEDWNFAYDCADTDYVTIAHQDDIYHPDYAHDILKSIEKSRKQVIIAITDYLPLKEKCKNGRDINSILRRLLRMPLKLQFLSDKRWIKKRMLSLGNSICCPTVMYNKAILGAGIFTSELKFNIDWDTFLKLACQTGRFLYVDKPLLMYRIHNDATTMSFIENQGRYAEDVIMFKKFWPDWFVKFIMKLYVKAYDTYR